MAAELFRRDKNIDSTLTVAGKSADAKATGDAVNRVKENIVTSKDTATEDTKIAYEIDTEEYEVPTMEEFSALREELKTDLTVNSLYSAVWKNRIYHITTGIYVDASSRIGTQSLLHAKSDITIAASDGYHISVTEFSAPEANLENQIFASGWKQSCTLRKGVYFTISLRRVDDTNMDVSECKNVSICPAVVGKSDWLANYYDFSDDAAWEVGSIYSSNGENYNDAVHAIRTPEKKPIYLAEGTVIKSSNDLLVTIYAFLYDRDTRLYKQRFGVQGGKEITVTESGYYRVVLLCELGSTVITDDIISDYYAGFFMRGKYLNVISRQLVDDNAKDYVISQNFTKKAVSLQKIGSISGYQSFCKYNGKYYSTDGSKLYVQDSALTLENTVSMNIGHGNALQLGSNGLAYASGWNDQKVYVVSLDTLEIVNTITLPTTGYTTVAVDDINKVMYIFQRDTTPGSAEENYNFIVYDYANESIVSSRKTTVSFAAMQACDFYHGRIVVLNGLGTTQAPNGYRIYDVNGNLISEYFLGSFETVEPEGVCIDRDTMDILISTVDKNLYRIH